MYKNFWQDAMTSKQVMLIFVSLLSLTIAGCSFMPDPPTDPMSLDTGIYPRRQLWAVVPLRNESGTSDVNGARIADTLASQLELQQGIDVLPINRVLAAMENMQLPEVTNANEALTLRHVLKVDALVVGYISVYDPYDPPKIGLGIELYADDELPWFAQVNNLTGLQQSAVEKTNPVGQHISAYDDSPQRQPITAVNGFFDASTPGIRRLLKKYARDHGQDERDRKTWRTYRLSKDLYTEFVANIVCQRLMTAENQRLNPTSTNAHADTQ